MFRTEEYHNNAKGRSILEIAGNVSSICRGSTQATNEELTRDTKCLEQVIEEWYEPFKTIPGEEFDHLTKKIIIEAIKMSKKFNEETNS